MRMMTVTKTIKKNSLKRALLKKLPVKKKNCRKINLN